MKQLLEFANELAERHQARLDTGYLLLAMMQEKGTTANLLKLRGLTPQKVLGQIQNVGAEPAEVLLATTDKALQIASSFSAPRPSPLHLLAAMAGFKKANANRIIEELGIDSMGVRTQALRRLTGVPEDRLDKKHLTKKDAGEALPLAEQLQIFSSGEQAGDKLPLSRLVKTQMVQQRSGDAPPPLCRSKPGN